MGQTLTHGIYLPDEGERNCYDGLAANWQLLDGAVGTVAEHTTQIAGKAPAVHTHTKADITDFPVYGTTAGTICEGNDSRLSDARTPVSHTHTKSDVTDLLNSDFIPSSDVNYTLGSSDLGWKQIWCSGYKTKSGKIDFTDSTTTGTKESWWVDAMEKNGTSFFGVGSYRNSQYGTNAEHFRIKNAGGKWADLYIQLDDNNQFTIGTSAHSDVIINGFRGKFIPLDSFIPNAKNSYDLGSSSYQWNNLYAKNYYYNGTAWGLDKANTWTGANTFTSVLKQRINSVYSQIPATDRFTVHEFIGTDDNRIFNINCADRSSGQREISLMVYATDGTFKTSGLYKESDNSFSFRSRNDNEINLGTPSFRWKTLNGVNPGALSLPDMSSGTGVSLSVGSNSYSPPSSGWLSINLTGAISVVCGNFCHSGTDMLSVPVVKGSTYTVTVATSGTAYLFVSQGNV